MPLTITFGDEKLPGARHCGDCQLCCRLLPVKEFAKPVNTRCQHQKFGKGCGIYARRPNSCRYWSCRWLVGDDTADQARPDRSHVVIDLVPDFITVNPNDGSEPTTVPVVQIWVDPKYPDAHRAPAIRAYMARRGDDGVAALVRWDNKRGLIIFPPAMCGDDQWHEFENAMVDHEHTLAETIAGIERSSRVKLGGKSDAS